MLQECHSKRYNIIVYKVPQEDTWEKIFVSESKVRTFLRDMVRIDEADTCLIADCHRLRTYSGRMPQPLIFRVGSMSIKRKIANNLKNLSTYNANLDKKDKVFVELDHLPERLKKDKKLLEEQFKVARIAGKKPSWVRNDKVGMLCLKVGGVVINPDRSAEDNDDY